MVGCGVAGFTAARKISQSNPQTDISIYTGEGHPYYPRPRLYEVLSGEVEPREIYMFSKQWYEDRDIHVYTKSEAVEINTEKKEMILKDGSKVNYDKLLLANGAHPFVPPIKGAEKEGVFTLRSIHDALSIKEYAEKTVKAIVMGGGLLGLEFAASLNRSGQEVSVLEINSRLLHRQLDEDGADVLKDRIESLGIEIKLGVKTEEILGGKKFSGVALDDGREVPGDLLLISAGVRSNINLPKESGIEVNRGVLVNEYLETSVKDIFAAGDVAEFEGRVYGIIPAAVEQAGIAAENILEEEKRTYEGTIPSNTLKIVGIDLTSIGIVNPEEPRYEEIKKIDREKGVYKKLVLEEGKIVGAIVLGEMKGAASIKRLIEQKIDVTDYKHSILKDDFNFKDILK
ncbi:MAG: NAD(P)/FAD-dependent oxidoreductase [Thermoproteota archaeon]